jgi:hypothetical protein
MEKDEPAVTAPGGVQLLTTKSGGGVRKILIESFLVVLLLLNENSKTSLFAFV